MAWDDDKGARDRAPGKTRRPQGPKSAVELTAGKSEGKARTSVYRAGKTGDEWFTGGGDRRERPTGGDDRRERRTYGGPGGPRPEGGGKPFRGRKEGYGKPAHGKPGFGKPGYGKSGDRAKSGFGKPSRPGFGAAGPSKPTFPSAGGFTKPGFRKEGGFARKEGGFARKEGGYARKEGGFARKEGGFARKEGGFARKEGGYARKEGGFARKEGGYARKEGGFARKGGRPVGKPGLPEPRAKAVAYHYVGAAVDNETSWGNVADWYDQLVGDRGSEYHQHVIIPGLTHLLGLSDAPATATEGVADAALAETQSLRVLDVACGQGVFCRHLAERGCDVTGIDVAGEMLTAAEEREAAQPLGIHYQLADVTKLVDTEGALQADLPADSFDVVTIVLSIQNISPITPVWQACHALLKPGGSLLVVMMHPCFRVPKQSDWHWSEATHVQSRTVSRYLTSDRMEILTHPGDAAHGVDDSHTLHFHRPLQAYINTLGNAGLYIDHVEEWASHKTDQAGPKKEAIDRARREIPMFLALRAKKV